MTRILQVDPIEFTDLVMEERRERDPGHFRGGGGGGGGGGVGREEREEETH